MTGEPVMTWGELVDEAAGLHLAPGAACWCGLDHIVAALPGLGWRKQPGEDGDSD